MIQRDSRNRNAVIESICNRTTGLSLLIAFASILPALTTLRESLWIDELHTAWVATGTWSELVERGSMGNQSPVAMGLWKLIWEVLPRTEWSLRIPSILFWFASFFVGSQWLFRKTSDQHTVTGRDWLIACILSFTMLFDWVSWFYAIEARPYAAVVFAVTLMLTSRELTHDSEARIQWRWALCAWLSVTMHYTAILVVVVHWLIRLWRYKSRKSRVIEIALCCIGWLPLVGLAIATSQRRMLWNDFAGHTDWNSVIGILPWVSWVVVPSVFLLFDAVLSKKKVASSDCNPELLWLIAGTLGVVWVLTALGIAPLMHRRYVLGLHMAIWLSFGVILLSFSTRRGVIAAGIVSVVLMVAIQGTWRPWVNREFMGWQRQEDWRSVISFLENNASPDATIAFAPMLIETTKNYPWNSEYASYPLSTQIYALRNQQSGGRVAIMQNEPETWNETLIALEDSKEVWIIARIHASQLAERLRSLDSQKSRWEVIQLDFGNLSVAKQMRSPSPKEDRGEVDWNGKRDARSFSGEGEKGSCEVLLFQACLKFSNQENRRNQINRAFQFAILQGKLCGSI